MIYAAAGKPEISKRFTVHEDSCLCSTCGDQIDGECITVKSLDKSTFSERAESFKFATDSICLGCAWLYGAGPSKPGNFFSTNEKYEQAVISLESVVEDKRPWLDILTDASKLDGDTPCTGVLTTDVKPRLWPRAQIASIEQFGLYVHAPEYDTSEWISFSLSECLSISELIASALVRGFAKASVYHGLMRDYQRFSKEPEGVLSLELDLSRVRCSPAFLPALLISGVTKEDKINAARSTDRDTKHATERGDKGTETQLGLF